MLFFYTHLLYMLPNIHNFVLSAGKNMLLMSEGWHRNSNTRLTDKELFD